MVSIRAVLYLHSCRMTCFYFLEITTTCLCSLTSPTVSEGRMSPTFLLLTEQERGLFSCWSSLFVGIIDLCMCADIKISYLNETLKDRPASLSLTVSVTLTQVKWGILWYVHSVIHRLVLMTEDTELCPKTDNRGPFAFLSHHPLLLTSRGVVDLLC